MFEECDYEDKNGSCIDGWINDGGTCILTGWDSGYSCPKCNGTGKIKI